MESAADLIVVVTELTQKIEAMQAVSEKAANESKASEKDVSRRIQTLTKLLLLQKTLLIGLLWALFFQTACVILDLHLPWK